MVRCATKRILFWEITARSTSATCSPSQCSSPAACLACGPPIFLSVLGRCRSDWVLAVYLPRITSMLTGIRSREHPCPNHNSVRVPRACGLSTCKILLKLVAYQVQSKGMEPLTMRNPSAALEVFTAGSCFMLRRCFSEKKRRGIKPLSGSPNCISYGNS